MRVFNKRALSLVLVLAMCISLLSGLCINASAATVNYVTGNPSSKYQNVIKNWGTRGTEATFLSPNAIEFYSDNNITYEDLAMLSGSSNTASVPSSALYKKLHQLVTDNQTKTTSYDDTRALYAYTDIQNNGLTTSAISCFYSGKDIGPEWDSGKTWNREHTWPNSKGDANGAGENDIMMLRPTSSSVNSSRGNKAYGESATFYDPNTASGGKYNLHGDVARIILYVYTRWGTANMWGSSGVFESKEVLLKWMAEDPVDTWEMGRNDSTESITGTRNVYVDSPELAFLLLGEQVPQMTTPSGEALGSGTVIPTTPTTPTTPEVSGPAVVTNPVAGTAYKFGMIQEAVSTSNVYYLKGGMAATYYLDTDSSIDAAIDVYLEATTGGYYLYTQSGSTKQYINMVVSGTYVNGAYEDTASTVYTFDEETDTIVATANGELYRFGTRSDKSYTTVGPVKVSMDNYYCKFYSVDGGEVTPTQPTEPSESQPTEPAPEGGSLTIAEAIALGSEMEHNQYTSEKYSVTGVISEVEAGEYGNMYITDGQGNYLYIYGTYNADGTTRYDALEVKPVAGDTVTIYGAIGYFNNAPQIKSGWITAHTVGVPPVTEPSEDPDASISFADKANRTSFSSAQQVWAQNGITVTNDKASSTTNVADYADPARFYKGSSLTIAAEGMVKIVFNCNNATYATELKNSLPTSGITATINTKTVTVELAQAADTFVIATLNAQVRINSIDIFTGSSKPIEPDVTEPTEPEVTEPTEPEVEPTTPVAGDSAELVFDSTDKRISFSSEQQVWQDNGITVTNDKAESTSAVADYCKPARFYKGGSLTIAAKDMVKLEFTCNTAAYATALVSSIPVTNGEVVTVDGKVVTVVLPAATDSFFIKTLSAQVRVDSLKVYFAGSETLKGDFSGDNTVNNDDVVVLLWHTLFPEENPVSVNADLNGDGAVNNDDVVILLWHCLFPEENPL